MFNNVANIVSEANGSSIKSSYISWIKMRTYPTGTYYIVNISAPNNILAVSHILVVNSTQINIYYKQTIVSPIITLTTTTPTTSNTSTTIIT